jgi:hypothetical protein
MLLLFWIVTTYILLIYLLHMNSGSFVSRSRLRFALYAASAYSSMTGPERTARLATSPTIPTE